MKIEPQNIQLIVLTFCRHRNGQTIIYFFYLAICKGKSSHLLNKVIFLKTVPGGKENNFFGAYGKVCHVYMSMFHGDYHDICDNMTKDEKLSKKWNRKIKKHL